MNDLVSTSIYATRQAAGLAANANGAYSAGAYSAGATSGDKGSSTPPTSIRVRNYGFRSVYVGATKCPPFATTTVKAAAGSQLAVKTGSATAPTLTSLRLATDPKDFISSSAPVSVGDNSMKQGSGKMWAQIVRNSAGSDVLKVWDAILGVPWFCVAGSLLTIIVVVVVAVAIGRSM
jgi:hypothetical protein